MVVSSCAIARYAGRSLEQPAEEAAEEPADDREGSGAQAGRVITNLVVWSVFRIISTIQAVVICVGRRDSSAIRLSHCFHFRAVPSRNAPHWRDCLVGEHHVGSQRYDAPFRIVGIDGFVLSGQASGSRIPATIFNGIRDKFFGPSCAKQLENIVCEQQERKKSKHQNGRCCDPVPETKSA
jgi:hypothetical protein